MAPAGRGHLIIGGAMAVSPRKVRRLRDALFDATDPQSKDVVSLENIVKVTDADLLEHSRLLRCAAHVMGNGLSQRGCTAACL